MKLIKMMTSKRYDRYVCDCVGGSEDKSVTLSLPREYLCLRFYLLIIFMCLRIFIFLRNDKQTNTICCISHKCVCDITTFSYFSIKLLSGDHFDGIFSSQIHLLMCHIVIRWHRDTLSII